MSPRFELSKSIALQKFAEIKSLADYVSYSSKTNPIISGLLEKDTDCLFSIHLENELKNINDVSRVLFLAQAWNKQIVLRLIEKGIAWFVVDNELDLDILLNAVYEVDCKINILLRAKLKERSIRTEKYFVFGMGAALIEKRIFELCNSDLKAKIECIGVHVHRKTQNMGEWDLKREFANMFSDEVLAKVDIINIGGGLPSVYANTNVDVIKSIKTKILECKDFLNKKNIKLMIEPGRFIAAPGVKLITTILSIHEDTIVVDASVYNADLDALIVPVKLKVEGELEKGAGRPFMVKGCTPCSMDLFRYRVWLKDPKIGDDLVFLNAGAYNFKTNFCELDGIPTKILEGEE